MAYEFYSSVLAYSQKKFPKDAPKSWADFWDVKKFPGRRALRNHPLATLEAALMADGVPPDKLYPLDVDRAFKKLEEIKPHITVWWTSGAQSAQLLNDGEVDMVMAWNGRVSARDQGRRQGRLHLQPGHPAEHLALHPQGRAEPARRRSNSSTRPSTPVHQANLPLHIDYGPGNPKAFETGVISPKRAAQLPSAPENAAKQALMSYAWWSLARGRSRREALGSFMQK